MKLEEVKEKLNLDKVSEIDDNEQIRRTVFRLVNELTLNKCKDVKSDYINFELDIISADYIKDIKEFVSKEIYECIRNLKNKELPKINRKYHIKVSKEV